MRLGWGDRTSGIALIAEHPSVTRESRYEDDDRYKANTLRRGDEILKRFTDAYREV